jgi:hypothetical protein
MNRLIHRCLLAGTAAVVASSVLTSRAEAFCGFYVSGGGAKMFNDATQVVLMRDGTRTVLSMQNDYNGPVADFAMVVPVPVVLKEADVKTLPKSVFDHVDSLGAPRLVEYWEQDPCEQMYPRKGVNMYAPTSRAAEDKISSVDRSTVKIEAKFAVGEYNILILSATEATGLETWLRANNYQIPADAAPLLRPYIEAGSKFFVAKVDPKKVTFEGNRAALSPLRFSYDSEEFSLPIRLGMANSSGTQDLVVNVIAADKRFEVANYKNVTIPTNFDVKDGVKTRFGEFYAALFDKTLKSNPGAVITEYSWAARPGSMCDPCPPESTLVGPADLTLLGGDVVGGAIASGTFVLTRMHARYGKADMKDDLRFREAKPIVGGREFRNGNGLLEYGSSSSSVNNFQARYAMRHGWTGAMTCKNPRRGIWGGPWKYEEQSQDMVLASKVAFAPRGKVNLPMLVKRDLPEIGVRKWRPQPKIINSNKMVPGAELAPTPAPTTTKKPLDLGVAALLALISLGAAHRFMRSSPRISNGK